MKITSFEAFEDLARRGTFVPVCKEIVADLLTPVSAFLKIAELADYAFLLESVEGGEHVGRYSFLGKDPFLILRSPDGKTTTIERAGATSTSERPFIDTLRGVMADFRSPFVPDLPRFTGGAVGYLGYGAASWFEPVFGDLGSGEDAADQAGFMLFDTVLAFDHVKHRILIIANARITADEDLESLYQFACAKIQFLERELERSLSHARPQEHAVSELRSNCTRDCFEGQVRTAKEYIAAGEVYQVVLSQRFEAEVGVDPFTVYRALRHVNPSPYMYFIRMGGVSVVGSSPEMLVRVEGTRVETHPIAGTRPRGRTPEEDLHLAEELKRNEKECAEHVMLVDLGRNDLGRVAAPGTVRVRDFFTVERFSHVMHLATRVTGKLAEGKDAIDALAATFPAGTLTGAPKIRAMEIIEDLEPVRRGAYGGAVGYLDFAGHLDMAIGIRTAVVRNGILHVQAGAGIVADSRPEAEADECESKACALMRAVDAAREYEP
jgi:anthranilate synthase component 1